MSKDTYYVAIVGCGVVGGGTARILTEQSEYLKKRSDVNFKLKYICDLNFDHARAINLDESLFTKDIDQVLNDEDIDIVVELVGGTTIAKTITEKVLNAKKHIVTANKALLATYGEELFALARKNGVAIGFEASCGGGIPIVRAIYDGLMANKISAFLGIVNGTCNYILSAMIDKGKAYEEVLKEAQASGLAEADPFLDVSGYDSAHKLTILSSLAFSASTNLDEIPVEGIDKLELTDVAMADKLGYTIKLLAIAEKRDDGISLRVRPAFISKDHPLAWVNGSFNAVSVYGNNVGHTMYYGRGAGAAPTASAVVSDIISIALDYNNGRFSKINIWPDLNEKAKQLPSSEIETSYYIRLMVEDKTGVLSKITSILKDYEISVSSVIQQEKKDNDLASVVITTYKTKEGYINNAISKLEEIKEINKIIKIDIVNEHKEIFE